MLVFFRGIPADVWRAAYARRTPPAPRPAPVRLGAVISAELARAA